MKRKGIPLRRYLFYGLTLVLATVFVFLAVQGRRMEKEQMQQDSEIVQKYTPTPTRVLAPGDLEILTASMIREQVNEEDGLRETVRHTIDIQNAGRVPYSDVQLSLNYIDADGAVLLSMPHNVPKRIPPGETVHITDISMENIPAGATDCRPKIVSADIASEK